MKRDTKQKSKATTKEKKKHIKDIMSAAINQEELDKRKAEAKEKEDKKKKAIKINEPIADKPKQWWQLPILKTDFKSKTIEGKFYAHHKEWKDNIWIGPYETKKELNSVISSYVNESSKDSLDRKLENVHSILIDI